MEHRIRAAALVVGDVGLLLVRHRHPRTGAEWWTPPGGGLEAGETVFDAARRETYQETGIEVVLDRIVYLQEFIDTELQRHNLEIFILARSFTGAPTIHNVRSEDSDALYIKEARFVRQREMGALRVFPEILKDEFWRDLSSGLPSSRYLGQRSGPNAP